MQLKGGIKSKFPFVLVFIGLVVLVVVGFIVFRPVSGCYGPHITGTVSRNEIALNETVTVNGTVCLGNEEDPNNVTIRVTFVRPDYSWIDRKVVPDNETGEFTVTQELDMAGYWNIFPIYGHINDRLGVTVLDPSGEYSIPSTVADPPFNPNPMLYAAAATAVGIGAAYAITGLKDKSRKIGSLRLFVQVGLVFIIFFGMFFDHQILPRRASRLPVHELLVAPDISAVGLEDGLPAPFFGCYYPCGRTVTCALWEIQTYIYPFWEGGRGWGVTYASSGLVRLGIVLGIVTVLSLILGRVFCGWVCPFGLYMDLLTYLRKVLKIPHKDFSEEFNEKFHQLGYVILALIIVLSTLFASQAIVGMQLIPGTEEGGFIYQYFSAPFCQVCPVKPLFVLLESSVGLIRLEWITQVTTGKFYQLGYYVTSLNLFILGLVTTVSFFYRRAWCRICPLGALIGLFNRLPPFKWLSVLRLDKVEEKCTKCGICKRVCPTQVSEVYEKKGGDVTTSQCILCLRCVELCPYEDTLKLKAAGKTVIKSRNWLE